MRTLVLPVTAHVIGGCGQLGGVESDDDHVIYCHEGRGERVLHHYRRFIAKLDCFLSDQNVG